MSQGRLRVSLMTAGLSPGDAISNYMVTLARILRGWGAQVSLYADFIAPEFQSMAQPSRLYPAFGDGLLWYHYSIFADNVHQAAASTDFTIMDYHGICPPALFAGQNAHLAQLCETGLALLPSLHDQFDRFIVHSEDSRRVLHEAGFTPERIEKMYLPVDTARLLEARDAALAASLSRVAYVLMVGRIVPQKDVVALLEILAHLSQTRPDLALVLAGTRDQTPDYQRELDHLVRRHGLTDRVLFTGQVNNPAVLAELYRHADLLAVTSEWESFCVPIAEALSFGVPAAVQNQPPMTEIAGAGGITFDKRDPAAAARIIHSLLADEAGYRAMSAAARQQAVLYTDATLADNLQRYLSRLLVEVFA